MGTGPDHPGPDDTGPDDTGPEEDARALLAAERAAVVARMAAAQVDVGRLIGAGQEVATDDEHDPAALQRARNQLTRIDDAQERLARGDCGRCLVCGQPIPVERLQALPTATTCTGCSPARRPTIRRDT